MAVFDTSALVPLFDKSHVHHADARAALADADEVLLHPCVLAEFTTVLRRLGKDAGQDGSRVAREALRALLDQPRCRVEDGVDHEAALELYHDDPALSYTDSVVAVLSRGSGLVAFDERLVRAARA